MFRAQLSLPHELTPARRPSPAAGNRIERQVVVVPLDGSAAAERALPAARAVSRRWNAELRLVHVRVPSPQANPDDVVLEDNGERISFRLRSDVYLDGVAARIAAASPVRVTTETIAGRSAAEALAEACAANARLVVIAPGRRSALARFWHGTVTDQLQRQLKVPLLVVPPAAALECPLAEPSFERILVPINERPTAQRVVTHALAMAGDSAAEFFLLRVIPLWTLARSHRAGGGSTVPVGSLASALRTEAWFRLREVREQFEGLQRSVDTRVVFDNLSPGASIVAHAGALQVDLITLVARRRFMPPWLRSSVPEYVAAHSPVPVLLCPAK